jgi:hypothetical protein
MRCERSRFDRLPTIDGIQVGRPRLRLKNPVLSTGGEVIDNSLYAFFSVAVDTDFDVNQVLFQNSIGQSYTPVGGTAFALTLLHTNMEGTGGQLPNGYKLDVQAIRLVVDQAIQYKDLDNLLFNTFGQFNIGQKYYWEGSLSEIPGNTGATLSQSPSTTNGPANVSGMPGNLKGVYSLSAGLEASIAYGQNFNFLINPTLGESGPWTTQTDGATPPGVGFRAWVHLDGIWYRPTQ